MSLKQFFLFACTLFALTFFVACEKEDSDEMEYLQTISESNSKTNSALDLINSNASQNSSYSGSDCPTISYPITIIFPGDINQEVDSDDALEAALEDWYAANPDHDEDPTLEFPITVTLSDGSMEAIPDEDALLDLLEDCYDYEDDDDEDEDEDHEDCDYDEFEDCFEINFPVTFILPNGNSNDIQDLETLIQLIEDYYDSNPNDNMDPTFDYPIEVTLDDGTIQSIGNDEELENLIEACEEEDEDEECFEFIFPISFSLADGSSHTVNSEEEAEDIIESFEDANPDLEDDPIFDYPIQILLEDGTTVSVNNENELEEFEEDCD